MVVLNQDLVAVIISVVQHWRMMHVVFVVEKVLFMNVDVQIYRKVSVTVLVMYLVVVAYVVVMDQMI